MEMSIEQDNIARTSPNGPMLVTGSAGSGKTSIGIKRAAFLLEYYCFDSDDSVLFVNNSKSFIEHSSYLIKRIQQEKGQTLIDLIQDRQSKISISSIDGMVYRLYKNYCNNNSLAFGINDENTYYFQALYEGIDALSLKYPDVVYLNKRYQQFLLNEIEWIRACGYLDEQQYQNAERIGLQQFNQEGPYKLNKNSRNRKAIFELMIFFVDCCKSNGQIDYVEANIMAMKSLESGDSEQYTHVVIDDCQDFTKAQLDLVIKLYRPKAYSSITFLFDDDINCASKSWLGHGRPFTTIGFDMTGRGRNLDLPGNNSKRDYEGQHSCHYLESDVTYKEINGRDEQIDFILSIVREKMSSKDTTFVIKNESIEIEIFKSENLLTIQKKK